MSVIELSGCDVDDFLVRVEPIDVEEVLEEVYLIGYHGVVIMTHVQEMVSLLGKVMDVLFIAKLGILHLNA